MHSLRTDDIYAYLLSTIRQQVSLSDFSTWLYAQNDILTLLDSMIDERLLAIDYGHPQALDLLRSIAMQVFKEHRPDLYDHESIRVLLCGIVNNTAPLIPACAHLSWYRMRGVMWIPAVFAGLDSELDAAEDEAVAWIEYYRVIAQHEARNVLNDQYADVPCQ